MKRKSPPNRSSAIPQAQSSSLSLSSSTSTTGTRVLPQREDVLPVDSEVRAATAMMMDLDTATRHVRRARGQEQDHTSDMMARDSMDAIHARLEAQERELRKKRTRAALCIKRVWQRDWSSKLTRQYAQAYMRDGPTSRYVRSISFDELVKFVREKNVVDIARRCLERIHLLCVFRHGSSPNVAARSRAQPTNVNVRVFLAGYMIAFRPTHVFENRGRLEQELQRAVDPMIQRFETIVAILANTPPGIQPSFQDVPRELTRDFEALLFEYLKAFKVWKEPDELKLTLRIKHALRAVYQGLANRPTHEPEDSQIRNEYRAQVERLRNKLAHIAGQEALAQFDAENEQWLQQQAGPIVADSGRAAAYITAIGEGASMFSCVSGRTTNEQLSHELLLDPTFQFDDGGEALMGRDDVAFQRTRNCFHRAFWDSLVDDLNLPCPSYVRVVNVLTEIRDALAEIGGYAARTRAGVSVSDVINTDLILETARRGAYAWQDAFDLMSAIAEIVQQVQSRTREEETARQWGALCARIERLQPLLGQTRVHTSAEPLLLTVPPPQPAPALGDESVAPHLRPARVLCAVIEFFLERVNAMRIDSANTQLRRVAAAIGLHGVAYETGKFDDRLRAGTLTLDRTIEWAREAVRRAEPPVLNGLLQGGEPAFVSLLHNDAVLSLVADAHFDLVCLSVSPTSDESPLFVLMPTSHEDMPRYLWSASHFSKTRMLMPDACPETFLFDLHRLHRLQFYFARIVSGAALWVTVSHGVGSLVASASALDAALAHETLQALGLALARWVRGPMNDRLETRFGKQAKQLTPEEEADLPSVDIIGTMETILAALRPRLSDADWRILMHNLRHSTDPDGQFFQLLRSRLRSAVATVMCTGSLPSPDESLVGRFVATRLPAGMAADVQMFAVLTCSLANLNRAVHMESYHRLFAELARSDARAL